PLFRSTPSLTSPRVVLRCRARHQTITHESTGVPPLPARRPSSRVRSSPHRCLPRPVGAAPQFLPGPRAQPQGLTGNVLGITQPRMGGVECDLHAVVTTPAVAALAPLAVLWFTGVPHEYCHPFSFCRVMQRYNRRGIAFPLRRSGRRSRPVSAPPPVDDRTSGSNDAHPRASPNTPRWRYHRRTPHRCRPAPGNPESGTDPPYRDAHPHRTGRPEGSHGATRRGRATAPVVRS